MCGTQACDPSTWKLEARGAQGHPQLHSKFKANMDYMRSCVKKGGSLGYLFVNSLGYTVEYCLIIKR